MPESVQGGNPLNVFLRHQLEVRRVRIVCYGSILILQLGRLKNLRRIDIDRVRNEKLWAYTHMLHTNLY